MRDNEIDLKPALNKAKIVDILKANSLTLSKIYGTNIHLEIDVNPKIGSCKVKVTEFVQ